MKNMLRLAFSRDDALAGDLDAELATIKPETLLDKARRATANALDHLRGSEVRLQNEIADREEELRQARLIIKAQMAADEIMRVGTLEAAE